MNISEVVGIEAEQMSNKEMIEREKERSEKLRQRKKLYLRHQESS
jgi:hypothetical protein